MTSGERVAVAILGVAIGLAWLPSSGVGWFDSTRMSASAERGARGANGRVSAAAGEAGARRGASSAGARDGAWSMSAFEGSEFLERLLGAGGSDASLEGLLASLLAADTAQGDGTADPTRSSRGSASGSPVTPVDFSYSNRDPSFRQRDPSDFDPRDLAVLEEIIRLNGLDESSSDFDYDDGDGVLEPTELGDQRWCNGRLRELRMGPDFFSSFGYQLERLPSAIADLDGLMVLEANSVGLRDVPREVASLEGLRRISVYNNELTELPPGLGELSQLAEVQATGNQIRRLPSDVERSQSLERVFVDMDQLVEMPAMLVRQQRAMESGELQVPPRQLGRLGASCLPSS